MQMEMKYLLLSGLTIRNEQVYTITRNTRGTNSRRKMLAY